MDVLIIMKVNEDEAEKFAEVEACDHLLEGLLARAGRILVNDDVVGSARKD